MGAPAPDLRAVAGLFAIGGEFRGGAPHGSGHIHDTFATTWREGGGDERRYVHQRLNERVFPDVPALMANVGRVTRHARERLSARGDGDAARRALALVPARDGADWTRDGEGRAWRTYLMIEGASTVDAVGPPAQARAAAAAFGAFQRLLADLGPPPLHETIPRFHDTPDRLARLEAAVAADAVGRVAGAREEIAFARARAPLAGALLALRDGGLVPQRIVHNDTKLNNVLLDDATGEGICVIDLDTVMPGLGLCDFGDLVRTGVSRAPEDAADPATVAADPALFAALAGGYLAGAGDLLVPAEREHLVTAGQVMTYECGLRFLTDHLAGDVYFRVRRPAHNLARCRAQFALLRSLERQEPALRASAARLAATGGEDA